MLGQCEPIASDPGPALYQNWVDDSCLLGCVILLASRRVERAAPPLLGYGVNAVAQHETNVHIVNMCLRDFSC